MQKYLFYHSLNELEDTLKDDVSPRFILEMVAGKHELCFLRHADVASKSPKCLFKNEMLDT